MPEQNTTPEPSLPFAGKWAALLLAIAVIVFAAARLYESCAWTAEVIPPLQCSWDGEVKAQKWQVALFVAGIAAFAWLAVSLAVFLWRWADALPLGGKWAVAFLAGIIAGEWAIAGVWDGYAHSVFNKVTDKVLWVLVLWLGIAWRGRSIMGWISRAPEQAKEWLADSLQKAVEAPIQSVRETVDSAAQTVKTAADDGVNAITKGLVDTKESVVGTVGEMSKSLTGKLGDAADVVTDKVGGAADTVADGAKQVSTAAGEGVDTAKGALSVAGDKITDFGKGIKDTVEDAASSVSGLVKSAKSAVGLGDSDSADVEKLEAPAEMSPLHKAAADGDAKGVKRLIEKKGNANQTDSAKQSPLHLAARAGHIDVVETLIALGADATRTDKNGDTPADVARKERGEGDPIAVLLSKAAESGGAK